MEITIKPLDVNITQLQNGITVVTEMIPHVKSFSLGFWFNVGSRLESPENNGISHFIEHMLFKGTKKRSARKISEEIEELGGYLNAFTSKEHTCFYGRGLSSHLEKTFEVLADMVSEPLFKSSDIKNESNVVIDELDDIEDNPEELIFDRFENIIFKGNKLELPIIGTKGNLKKFKKRDLDNFMKKHYTFDNLYIVASGLIQHKDVVKYAYKYLQKDLGKCEKTVLEPVTPHRQNLYINKETQQTHVIIGNTTEGYCSKRRVEISVLSNILGEGSSSRLFQNLREKNGIAYQINTFLNSFYDVSTFGVYFSTNDKTTEKALDIIRKEFVKIKSKKVTEKELNRSKEYIIGNMIMSMESTNNRMMRIGQSMIYYGKVRPMTETIRIIGNVTPKMIQELAHELLNESELVNVMLSAKNKLLKKAA
ncbi:peptidase [bacterium BRH_c32]|nr:MAG: peptidase [bacterium BRH_c32]